MDDGLHKARSDGRGLGDAFFKLAFNISNPPELFVQALTFDVRVRACRSLVTGVAGSGKYR